MFTFQKHLKKLPLILGLLMLTGILSACSSWFQPKTKTIEYDEQVKLHNGEMIWVHITRHYFLAGEIAHGSGYMPGAVEISWDTGFEGVGRKSLEFSKNISLIDKVNNRWYIGGFTPNCSSPCIKDNYIKLNVLGSMAVINSKGSYVLDASIDDLPNNVVHNIISPEAIRNWQETSKSFNNARLTWQEKKAIKNQQKEPLAVMGKPIYRGNAK